MTQEGKKDFAASVRDRLFSTARRMGRNFESVLILYALERFLFRLSRSAYRNRFLLKGGLLLVGIGVPLARTTRDIDFLGTLPSEPEGISRAIQEIGEIEINDGIIFDFSEMSRELINAEADYPGVKFRLSARLGQARIPVQIDVGFGDAVVPASRQMVFPTLLEMEPPVVNAYSLETVVAEKFEAALDLSDLNSRMKDFYDLWIIGHGSSFRGLTLQDAVAATCGRRKTVISSEANMFSQEFAARVERQEQWRGFVRKVQLAGVPESFKVIMGDVGKFLLPIAAALEKGTPFETVWQPGGPWRPNSGSG
jgi:predicted nucleotidyltransferase component of viral defense system